MNSPARSVVPGHRPVLLHFLFCAALASGGGLFSSSAKAQKTAPSSSAAELAFRDAAVSAPPGYQGRRFKLSRDYPTRLPPDCPECSWLQVKIPGNFAPNIPATPMPAEAWNQGPWAEYIGRILNYVKEGQDPELANEVGFRTRVNGQTRWFNVPWMAVDPTAGREFIHGTTNERTAHLSDIIGAGKTRGGTARGVHRLPGTTEKCLKDFPHGFESWSVGYYNPYGGMALGQAFAKDGKPRMAQSNGISVLAGLPFPKNTMVVKVLTTSAPEDCVPFLKGAPQWTVDRHVMDFKTGYQCERKPQISRVVQIDVAVVDERNPSRWVYGTFVYDGTSSGKTFWERMKPLGVQWGSDPWTFPAVPRAESQPLQQTVLNPAIKLPEHQGCEMRLAGPVDNPASSCVSCHASAFAAPLGSNSIMGVNVPPSFGFPGMCSTYSQDNVSYFQNVTAPQAFPGGRFPKAISLDTSLQLEVALTQYGLHATKMAQTCKNPNQF